MKSLGELVRNPDKRQKISKLYITKYSDEMYTKTDHNKITLPKYLLKSLLEGYSEAMAKIRLISIEKSF